MDDTVMSGHECCGGIISGIQYAERFDFSSYTAVSNLCIPCASSIKFPPQTAVDNFELRLSRLTRKFSPSVERSAQMC